MKLFIISLLLSLMGIVWVCSEEEQAGMDIQYSQTDVIPAAERTDQYIDRLKGRRVGIVGNHSSMIEDRHLVDSLLNRGIEIKRIFSPEHGFRGTASAGEIIRDGRDAKTGLPVVSLYGKNKKPSISQLSDLDLVLFDIQDVGVRFYTYISSLHYMMEACAEASIPLIVLDRPNPNGHYVDGPVLDSNFSSFIGMHPVPVVYGMSIGEYARMINGEGWLKNWKRCSLTVIRCKNYRHDTRYTLPRPPSPNLPDERSVLLYPSLCFFEGTIVSVGRGTTQAFSIYGHPDLEGPFRFKPRAREGAKHPKLKGELCRGYDLSDIPIEHIRSWKRLELRWLISAYESLEPSHDFFSRPEFFDKLAGGTQLRRDIIAGKSEEMIRASWGPEIEKFKQIRNEYLLYE